MVKAWAALAPVAVPLSPKFQEYEVMLAPEAADEPDPLKVTVKGAWPAAVVDAITAVGGVFGRTALTVMEIVFVLVWFKVLVMVSLAV